MRPIIGLTISSIVPEVSGQPERFGLSALYCRAVAEAGGAPVLIPGLGDPEMALAHFQHLDGLLLTGGPDAHPERYGQHIHPGCERIDEARDATELALIAEARQTGLPILGICRGHQMLNIAFGGTLIQDIRLQRPDCLDHRSSALTPSRTCDTIAISAGSRVAESLNSTSIGANSMHHQAVDILAPGFVVTARSDDGIVEAIEDSGHPFRVGVQCHPEHLFGPDSRWLGLFRAFVGAAAGSRLSASLVRT